MCKGSEWVDRAGCWMYMKMEGTGRVSVYIDGDDEGVGVGVDENVSK